MTLLIQDGRRGGHLKWAVQAINAATANGVVISAFHTPRVAIPRHHPGRAVAEAIRDAGGEAIFDASTHARLLPGSDDLVHYDTWQLWGPSGIGLESDDKRLEHLERVFTRQGEIGAPLLAPTATLDSPLGQAADDAFRTAQLGRGLERTAWQSLAGRRSFWRSGPDLDAYVGQLASLRAPCWVLTVVNDIVADNVPELSDVDAFTGFLRTVHSLSRRGRVIVCHADYAGVPAVAAGANTVGTGWDRGMRFFDPRSFQVTSAGIQIPASYVTQGGLAAVLRRDTADAISTLGDPLATRLRGGSMPANDAEERSHHLAQLSGLVARINGHGGDRRARVNALRDFYEQALLNMGALLSRLPTRFLNGNSRDRWLAQPHAVLRAYAEAERLW